MSSASDPSHLPTPRRWARRPLVALLAGAALTLVAPSAARADEPKWKQIDDTDGVRVWERSVEGSSFVEFRGRGMVGAPMPRVLAVLRDQDRKTEWMERCVSNRAIAYTGTNRMTVYHRIGSPFFTISDRDVVLDVRGEIDEANRTITIRFESATHKSVPEQDGAVRMPKLKGHWRMTAKGDDTEVEYQVAADPGGALPAFVVNWASRGIPLNTLRGLRKQLQKDGYEKELAFVETAYDWDRLLQKQP